MSFFGSIESIKHKIIWNKAIASLAAISDRIKFIVSLDSLSLSAINIAGTTHGEIIFKKSFFHTYYTKFTPNKVEENEDINLRQYIDQDEESGSLDCEMNSYSFLVNSKHLFTLFKNMDSNDLHYIWLKADWSPNTPRPMQYILLIEIKTKKLIIKKYRTSYQPVVKNKLKIAERYHQNLYDQSSDAENHSPNCINFFIIEQIIFKDFLDLLPSTTEDFKIEAKNDRILFTGFTKQIVQEKEILKHPMSVTITLSIEELINSNLRQTEMIDVVSKKAITFRLRDLRNFILLLTSIFGANEGFKNEEFKDLSLSDYNFEIFFRKAGDPILFEMKSDPNLLVQYVQITGKEGPVSDDDKNSDTFVLPRHVLRDIKEQSTIEVPDLPHLSSLYSKSATEEVHLRANIMGSLAIDSTRVTSLYGDIRNDEEETSHLREASSEPLDIVTYDKSVTSNIELSMKRHIDNTRTSAGAKRVKQGLPNKRIIIDQDQDTDYSKSDEETYFLGPTQIHDKPKSILD
ncbi:uncharacterized protein PRCAT00005653001 [Priceomyces carsonii]|uniref:uncharacterized protein n=1 Tax=Priceomyces carsonii TaxID=28549 RepID=UPI002ED8591F|nr:unnamed protein product [Priceomyces carsonii]